MNKTYATIITIGDELLIGQTIDTNSAWLAKRLNTLGIDVRRRVAVGDNKADIESTLNDELQRSEILILTGGLGPTSDDITKPLLCEYFGGKLVVNETVLAHITALFKQRNRPFLERNLMQAQVPDNCKVLFNAMGTAPGMWFEKQGRVVISLPGVPMEMQRIMEDEGFSALRRKFVTTSIVHKTIFTAGEGESAIAQKLMQFEEVLPDHISLAYLPDFGMVRLRLTGHGDDRAALDEQLSVLQQKMASILGDIVLAMDDLTLEQILGAELTKTGKTIGIAESCTGGTVGHYLTLVPGASAYFKGGVVSYDNAVKTEVLGVPPHLISENGAVSEATVVAMAEGARKLLNVDYTISISGVLGPDGGTERVSVGTVWMAVASANRTKAREFKFFYDRERNKELAAKTAMLYLLKFVKSHS